MQIVEPGGGEGLGPGKLVDRLRLGHAGDPAFLPQPKAPVHVVAEQEVVPIHHARASDGIGANHQRAGTRIAHVHLLWELRLRAEAVESFHRVLPIEPHVAAGFLEGVRPVREVDRRRCHDVVGMVVQKVCESCQAICLREGVVVDQHDVPCLRGERRQHRAVESAGSAEVVLAFEERDLGERAADCLYGSILARVGGDERGDVPAAEMGEES
jgi:hypothetical protein